MVFSFAYGNRNNATGRGARAAGHWKIRVRRWGWFLFAGRDGRGGRGGYKVDGEKVVSKAGGGFAGLTTRSDFHYVFLPRLALFDDAVSGVRRETGARRLVEEAFL